LKSLEQDITELQLSWNLIGELEAIATEAEHLRCQLNIPDGNQILEQLIVRLLWQLLYTANSKIDADIQRLERLIDVGYKLHLGINLNHSQELYWSCLHSQILPRITSLESEAETMQCRQLLKLGQKLAVDVSPYLDKLP
jgi:alpha-amylase/alpha-mannosidase (GH57 family)